MDETHDAMRAIRSKNYKLIHNLMPERPYCQFNWYKEGAYPALAEMNILNLKGKLTPEQAAFFAPTKPKIELFDLRKDPVGWPAWFPTRTLEEWEKVKAKWEPYVFRSPTDPMTRPNINTYKPKKNNK